MMNNSSLSSTYHDRFDLEQFAHLYEHVAERNLQQQPFVASPFDVYSVEKFRSKWLAEHSLSEKEKIPTELFVWGRGEPEVLSGTKIGGEPVWNKDAPLPDTSIWKYFGQFNLGDSLDLLTDLPQKLVSIWGNDDFPWEDSAISGFWIDPDTAVPISECGCEEYAMPGAAEEAFFGQLYRSWDPVIDWDIVREIEVDHQFEVYRLYTPSPWKATKFQGIQSLPQWGPSERKHGKFVAQFTSIQPSCEFPFPWVNKESTPGLSCHDRENCRVLGDMGSFAICQGQNGEVNATFECH